jgi:hypothetical protein
MTSTSIARLAQLKAHLDSNVGLVGSGGGATSSTPLILYDLKSNLGLAWSVGLQTMHWTVITSFHNESRMFGKRGTFEEVMQILLLPTDIPHAVLL